jgi:hypothetical protein
MVLEGKDVFSIIGVSVDVVVSKFVSVSDLNDAF